MLDKFQSKLHTRFNREHYLSNSKSVERIIDWCTFYRRNMPVFIEHYLGINLHLYQVIWIYLLSIFPNTAIVAGRASAKSYIIAVFTCATAILRPGSMVVVGSATKKQAGLIVSEKIQKQLMPKSPNLRREIKKIRTGQNEIEVIFRNGSSIVVCAANENSRGLRSTVEIFEEFRQIKKSVVDSVMTPFQMIRPVGFMTNPENNGFYEKNEELKEEPVSIYISSSGTTSDWMWPLINTKTGFMRDKFKDNSACVLATDYSIALRHNIKSKKQLIADKKKVDPITWRIEYENEMLRENTNAYFTFDMLHKNQRLKAGQCFYPRKNNDVILKKKNPFAIPKQPGEIRITSWDFAFVESKKNDNSAVACIRLLPETNTYENQNVDGKTTEVKQGYRRVVCYLETHPGRDVDKAAIRVKQIFYDFEADFCVMDMKNGGILIYDRLAKVLYDEDRREEYPAWKCFNDQSVANRVNVTGAKECVFVVNADAKMNNDIAVSMESVLKTGMIDFLVNHVDAVDEMYKIIPEYTDTCSVDTLLYYDAPYTETQALFNEMVALEYEIMPNTRYIRLHEAGYNTKDRYISLAYGSYYASLLEQDLFSDTSDYDYDFSDDDYMDDDLYDDEIYY